MKKKSHIKKSKNKKSKRKVQAHPTKWVERIRFTSPHPKG
jgi:hypothetical protein